MAAANVVEFTPANWQEQVVNNPNPVLVDFWGPHCGPCRQIAPYMDQLATEFAGQVTVGKVNVEDDGNMDLANEFRISYIPQVFVLKNGQVVSKIDGVRSKQVYADALTKAINS